MTYKIPYEEIVDHLRGLEVLLQSSSVLERIISCALLSQSYDSLCFQDAPFSRETFLRCVADVSEWMRSSQLSSTVARARQTPEEHRIISGENDRDSFTAKLYARCWTLYDSAALMQSGSLFEKRLLNNGIDSKTLVSGRRCLDAGCGSGRFTFALHSLEAARVVGLDFSSEAIAAAITRREKLQIYPATLSFLEGSVLAMPDDWDDSFDFVVSNGVLHCTPDSARGLAEVFRIMKHGGHGFIYVYGGGGLRWDLTDMARRLIGPESVDLTWQTLSLLRLLPHQVYWMMDDWFVPIIEINTREGFTKRLRDAGFSLVKFLERGWGIFDSVERRWFYPDDIDLLGEGDLRFLVRKE